MAEGLPVASVTIDDDDEVIGVNNRVQLAEAEAALRRRINTRWMLAGVTLADPATTYIEPGVELGPDTVVLPNTHLCGATKIGADCVLGPNTIVRDTTIGDRCQVECSVLEGAWLAEDVSIGPFGHLRPGARLERGVHMGNFGEVKNSTLGPGVKMGHFSYVGDATLGAGGQRRRRHHHLQFRRGQEEQDRHRRQRLYRQRYAAGGAGDRRRRRAHRRRRGGHQERAARHPGRGHAGPRHPQVEGR